MIEGLTGITKSSYTGDDLISRQDAINAIDKRIVQLLEDPVFRRKHAHIDLYGAKKLIREIPSAEVDWIPCSERMPEHSYTKRFWLTVKLDDGTITTLIGTWGAWCGCNDSKSYDAFNCWKDTMINGGIYRLSQPIPKEQVLAWMPAPEPYEGGESDG